MRLKNAISDILRLFSLIAALCVVAIHANVDGRWNFICGTLTSWAVPFFFVQSGFFFGISEYIQRGEYRKMFQKKVQGLLLPYLLWVFIAIVTCYPLVILNNHLKGIPLLERTVFAEKNVWLMLDRTFGIMHNAPEPIGVLWFVRALMILFLCAPIWRFFARRSLSWLFVCLFVLLHFYFPRINFHGFQLSIGVASFFFLGIVFAVYLHQRC